MGNGWLLTLLAAVGASQLAAPAWAAPEPPKPTVGGPDEKPKSFDAQVPEKRRGPNALQVGASAITTGRTPLLPEALFERRVADSFGLFLRGSFAPAEDVLVFGVFGLRYYPLQIAPDGWYIEAAAGGGWSDLNLGYLVVNAGSGFRYYLAGHMFFDVNLGGEVFGYVDVPTRGYFRGALAFGAGF